MGFVFHIDWVDSEQTCSSKLDGDATNTEPITWFYPN